MGSLLGAPGTTVSDRPRITEQPREGTESAESVPSASHGNKNKKTYAGRYLAFAALAGIIGVGAGYALRGPEVSAERVEGDRKVAAALDIGMTSLREVVVDLEVQNGELLASTTLDRTNPDSCPVRFNVNRTEEGLKLTLSPSDAITSTNELSVAVATNAEEVRDIVSGIHQIFPCEPQE
jgi:hypothetical protein